MCIRLLRGASTILTRISTQTGPFGRLGRARNRGARRLPRASDFGSAGRGFESLRARQPQATDEPAGVTQDEETPPTAEDLAHAAERLEAKGLDASRLEELAATYGIGGAVRLIAWSADPAVNMSIDDLIAKRDTGSPEGGPMGWGKIARELGVSRA